MLGLAVAAILRTGVTADIGPAVAGQVLHQLSLLTGERLECSPELRKEVLMVRVNDVPLDELKRRLAKVAWAEWARKEDVWMLERPGALARKQNEALLDRRAKLLGKLVAEQSKRVEAWSSAYLNGLLVNLSVLAEKAHNATRETESQLRGNLIAGGIETPAGRALCRLLGEMDPRELAAIRADSMATYSDTPTRMERSLPRGAREILGRFLSEERDFASELERRNDLAPPTDFLDPRFNISASFPPASRFVLTIRRYGSSHLEATLSAIDANGWIVASARKSMILSGDGETGPFAQAPSKPIELSERAADYRLIFTVVSGNYAGDLGDRDRAYRLAENWLPLFGDAEKTDPMSFLVGDGLEKVSQALNVNLVADLPDNLLSYVVFADEHKKLTTARFLEEMSTWGMNTTGAYGDGWLDVMPEDPDLASADRIDRAALSRLAKNIATKKTAYLDDLADYAASQPGGLCFRSIDQAIAAVYSRGAAETGAGLANRYYVTALRFWGSLSPAQRALMRKGEGVGVANLSERAKAWLGEYVYGIPQAFATNFETPYTPDPRSLGRRNIKASPYEGLPDGIPIGTTVTGLPISEPMLRIRVKNDPDTDGSTPDILGDWFAGQGWPLEGADSPLITVAYAYAPMVKVSFDFGHGYTGWFKLGDDVQDYSAPSSYSDLPVGIRRQIELRYAAAAAQKAKDYAAAKGRKIPPRQP
ncbi:MAG TPA: hypothetical protein VHE55_18905 [Fimbriimonadaceae bacterium]|nr:hypothetical protein [Fimbriimonadaceae bacterium]